jgi:hypothetical protein
MPLWITASLDGGAVMSVLCGIASGRPWFFQVVYPF